MAIWTANNQTVWCEIPVQLHEKPVAGRKTTNEEHRLNDKKEKKLAVQWKQMKKNEKRRTEISVFDALC